MDMNVDLFHQATPVVPHIKHAAKHAAQVAPHIKQGINMTLLLGTNAATAIIFAAIGWYVKGRGWFGVKVDIANAEANVKKEITAVTHPTPVA